MEFARPTINHIPCPRHKEVIRKVDINNSKTDLYLLWIECIDSMEGKQNQELILLKVS